MGRAAGRRPHCSSRPAARHSSGGSNGIDGGLVYESEFVTVKIVGREVSVRDAGDADCTCVVLFVRRKEMQCSQGKPLPHGRRLVITGSASEKRREGCITIQFDQVANCRSAHVFAKAQRIDPVGNEVPCHVVSVARLDLSARSQLPFYERSEGERLGWKGRAEDCYRPIRCADGGVYMLSDERFGDGAEQVWRSQRSRRRESLPHLFVQKDVSCRHDRRVKSCMPLKAVPN